MAGELTYEQVGNALKALGRYRVAAAVEAAAEGPPDGIGGHHVLALGLRETGLRNVNNDADTDHGCFQINERWHGAFLRGQPGCPEGSWRAVAGHTAAEDGYCPRYTPAMVYALDMLKAHKAQAESDDVPAGESLRVALNAYNRGYGGALEAWRDGEPDRGTTGGDYGSWCLSHARHVKRWLDEHPEWKTIPS